MNKAKHINTWKQSYHIFCSDYNAVWSWKIQGDEPRILYQQKH